jgi:hypothetical protein
MSDTYEQANLFNDPTVAAEERELFGDQVRPTRPELDAEGDYLHGWVVSIERDVDLKTGFAPVDIVTLEAVSGALAAGTKRAQKGRRYALAVMHASLKNRLSELDPQPQEGERLAVRRGRDFRSTQGPSEGKMITAWDVVMPDRPKVESEPEPKGKRGTGRQS